jgi:dienelactone hydrolase
MAIVIRRRRFALAALACALVLGAVGLAAFHSWLHAGDFLALRGALEAVTWGEPEACESGWVVPFAASSASGLEVTGLLRLPPDVAASEAREVALVLGGLRIGARAACLIDPPPGRAVAAIDYPYRGPVSWRSPIEFLRHLPALLGALRTTGPAISLAASALAEHPALGGARAVLVGASLGVPFVVRAAAAEPRYAAVALLYGFADLEPLLEHSFRRLEWPGPVCRGAAGIAYRLVHHLDPALHLGRLDTVPVLLVNTPDDHLVPAPCIEALHRAAPVTATIRMVDGGHVLSRNPALVAKMTDLVFAWVDEFASAPAEGEPEDGEPLREGEAELSPSGAAGG